MKRQLQKAILGMLGAIIFLWLMLGMHGAISCKEGAKERHFDSKNGHSAGYGIYKRHLECK